MTHSFEVGDHVYVGEPAPDKVHWVIERFDRLGMAHLVSPMSGRRAGFYPQNLTLHTPSTRIAKEPVA